MQPGTPGPGQDPYQQNPYNQYPFSPQSGPPYDPTGATGPYPPDPFAAPSSPMQPPQEYSLYSQPAPPPPQYPAAGYSVPPMPPPVLPNPNNNNTFGILSLVFGIFALPMVCCYATGAAIGIGAVILGVLGVQKANRGEADNKGMAIAGIVCGGVAAFFGLLWIIGIAAFHFGMPNYT